MQPVSKGFTLIELLIVIAIIGVLTSVVIVSQSNSNARSRLAKNIAELQSISTALEAYHALHGSYPVSQGWQGYCSNFGANLGVNWIPELAADGLGDGTLPIDPRNNGNCWDGQAQYLHRSDGINYKLVSNLSETMPTQNILIDTGTPKNVWGYWSPGAVGPGWTVPWIIR